jgi:SNF family Na+-dependent transporter
MIRKKASGHTPRHEHWSRRKAFVLAATGSAAGLGKIWKFPCITGAVFLHAIGAI